MRDEMNDIEFCHAVIAMALLSILGTEEKRNVGILYAIGLAFRDALGAAGNLAL